MRPLQTADTPFKIRRIFIARIIVVNQFPKHNESLMAYNHAISETVERKYRWSYKMTVTDPLAGSINDLSLAIDYSGIIIVHNRISYFLKSIFGVKGVSGIKKYHIITLSQSKPFVHCII
nr:hypothetical protein [Duncaniella muris]